VSTGAREVAGIEVSIYQVPELVPADILEKSGAKAARTAFAHVPVAKPEKPRGGRVQTRHAEGEAGGDASASPYRRKRHLVQTIVSRWLANP
jgi:hypothetical protein